tara:strand:- start:301 stop:552 length:252 start_codon:yes stop_codon:yes gene_type:complete|eukprot:scaffold87113_cov69-Phaeocystis_antarctica.AAC.4
MTATSTRFHHIAARAEGTQQVRHRPLGSGTTLPCAPQQRTCFAVVQCSGERRPYGNFVLTKGVVGPDGSSSDLKLNSRVRCCE